MRREAVVERRDPRWFRPPPLSARLPALSAVVLLRDAERRFGSLTASLLHVLPEVARSFELILVDDRSHDRTGAMADDLARAQPAAVRVLRHDHARSIESALQAGLGASRFAAVFLTDGRAHPAQLRAFLGPFERADLVVGHRRWRRARVGRRLLAAAWSGAVGRALGVAVHDPGLTCVLARRDAIEGMVLRSAGTLAAAELIAQVARRGGRVVEVPVAPLEGAGAGGRGGPHAAARTLLDLVRLRSRRPLA